MLYLTISFVIVITSIYIEYLIGLKISYPLVGLLMPLAISSTLIYLYYIELIWLEPVDIIVFVMIIAIMAFVWIDGHIKRSKR